MNRYARKVVTCASIVSALALVPVSAALAQDAPAAHQEYSHAHRAGLLVAALKLDSLAADQRAAIEGLQKQRRAATAPVRAADAQVLTLLAEEVERGSVDGQALAPALGAEHAAADAETAVDASTLNQLHAILTPAQRGQLVDAIEAAHGRAPRDHDAGPQGRGTAGKTRMWGNRLGLTPEQKAQIAANLAAEGGAGDASHGQHRARGDAGREQAIEAFRAASFDAHALVHVEHRGDRAQKIAQAMVPVLTPAQRATFASGLRARAARESHG